MRSRRSLNPGESVKEKGPPQAPYMEARAGASHSDGSRGQVSGVDKRSVWMEELCMVGLVQ